MGFKINDSCDYYEFEQFSTFTDIRGNDCDIFCDIDSKDFPCDVCTNCSHFTIQKKKDT